MDKKLDTLLEEIIIDFRFHNAGRAEKEKYKERILQLFPKSAENPDGYEPKPGIKGYHDVKEFYEDKPDDSLLLSWEVLNPILKRIQERFNEKYRFYEAPSEVLAKILQDESDDSLPLSDTKEGKK